MTASSGRQHPILELFELLWDTLVGFFTEPSLENALALVVVIALVIGTLYVLNRFFFSNDSSDRLLRRSKHLHSVPTRQPTVDRTRSPHLDERYVYFGGLTDRQREACHRVQDLLTAKNGRRPKKPDLHPYVEKLRSLGDAELMAIINGTAQLPEIG